MSALLMVGAQPDNDNSLTTQEYIDQRQLLTAVTQAQTDAELTVQLTDRATKAYVDQQDALKVSKTYVDTQDAKLVPKTAHGAASGAAQLNASLQVPLNQMANVSRGWGMAHVNITRSAFSSSSTSKVLIGSVTLPDPGYKYTPIISGAGFETYVTSSIARGDLQVTVGSQTGAYVAYGTGKIGVSDSFRGHIEIVPDSVVTTLTGSQTFYISGFRGFGSGTVSFYSDLAWMTVIAMPVV